MAFVDAHLSFGLSGASVCGHERVDGLLYVGGHGLVSGLPCRFLHFLRFHLVGESEAKPGPSLVVSALRCS